MCGLNLLPALEPAVSLITALLGRSPIAFLAGLQIDLKARMPNVVEVQH
jgi:hypothetical protein